MTVIDTPPAKYVSPFTHYGPVTLCRIASGYADVCEFSPTRWCTLRQVMSMFGISSIRKQRAGKRCHTAVHVKAAKLF